MAHMVAPVVDGRWPAHISGEWTNTDLARLPADGLRYEIIDGILQVSPAPVPVHQRVVARLLIAFAGACPDDLEVFTAPLDWQPDQRTSLQPDLMVVPKRAIGAKGITGTPAVVVEVLSPSTARIDRMLKYSRYAEAGIGQYWIIDPAEPLIQVFSLVEGSYELATEGSRSQPVSAEAPISITVVPAALVAD